ncbi:MAG: DsbA family protein [Candidatus Woesearchaeota archaeon]|nr:MAG: DsbA family protein [Candidatus Woesearchaeota archaeon]
MAEEKDHASHETKAAHSHQSEHPAASKHTGAATSSKRATKKRSTKKKSSTKKKTAGHTSVAESKHVLPEPKPTRENNSSWAVPAFLILLVIIAIIVVSWRWTAGSTADWSQTGSGSGNGIADEVLSAYMTNLAADAPSIGSDDAPVVIVEFSDFQCPYCGKFDKETFDLIKTNYVDTGKVKFVYRDLPLGFHENAQKAAEASLCAHEQGKFWEYARVLYEHQSALSVPNLKSYAADLGLEVDTFTTCLDSGSYAATVAESAQAAAAAGISGTPGFVINGKVVSGAQPYEKFAQAIEAALGGEGSAPVQKEEPANLELVIVNDASCALCDPARIVQVSKEQLFPTLVVREVDYQSTEGQALIEELDLKVLPAYLFESRVTETNNYDQLAQAVIAVGDYYLLNPQVTGLGKYLDPATADDDPVLGDANAPVTIIEFSDYECPYCGKFRQETFDALKSTYIDTGKVKLVFRDLPLSFHEHAQNAALASECADDQGMFWEYHDALFAHQTALTVADLKSYAADLGLEVDTFNACLDSQEHAAEVAGDAADAAAVGVTGTPGFFINDMFVPGALPFETFQQIIEAELAN